MAGVSTPDAAVDQWMNIDFARERILNADATTMSVGHYEGGVYNNYWVLIFSYPENSYSSNYRQAGLSTGRPSCGAIYAAGLHFPDVLLRMHGRTAPQRV